MGIYVNGYVYNIAGGVSSGKIVEATENWLEENVAQETGYVIDNSLTIAGAAADAKKTGDELSDLKSVISDPIAGLNNKAPAIIDSASGAIASFPDGANGMPVKSLVCEINPVQNLHGYDHPQPAGGGKNLIPFNTQTITDNGITFTPNSDGTITVNGTASANANYFFIGSVNEYVAHDIPPGDYILSGGSYNAYLYVTAQNKSTIVDQGTPKDVTIEDGDLLRIFIRVVSGRTVSNLVVKPMLRKATEIDDTFEPYSNICPISGWTGATVTRAGKNIWSLGNISSSQTGVTFSIPAGTYTLSGTGSINANITFHYSDSSTLLVKSAIGKTFTLISSVVSIDIQRSATGTISKIQLELGSTTTDYEPYQANTYPINFEEAGTVYGGTLDVTNGVLTVDRISATLDGSEDWNMYSTGKYYVNNVGSYYFGAAAGKYISNLYPFSGNGSSTSASITKDKYFYGQKGSVTQNYRRIWVYDSSYSTLEDFKAALNSIPLQVVIPIASPIGYDLSGIPEITPLLGTNNIWADCGDVEVEYRADTKLYIQKINAPSDDDMTADTQIPSGKYFIIGNNLYLSTTTIPAGDTIIPGTNCTKTNLAEALNALNS